jgi:GMP synthase (glutamine-hydrolysing)
MARPKILVFQHVPYEPLGTLDPLLKHAGFKIRYVNFGREPESRPTLDGYEAIIILGGPMNSDQIDEYPNLKVEGELIQEAVEKQMAVLGICLGAQLLARALGGAVVRNARREIGWHKVALTRDGEADSVLASFSSEQQVFQWHEDGIELPPGAVHLAASKDSVVQAFRYGEHAYGFQFHLEVNRSLIERWLVLPANQAILQAESGRVDPQTIRQQSDASISALESLSQDTFTRWIERFEIAPRRRSLPSR